MTLSGDLDALELQRVGLLVVTAASMSRSILIQQAGGAWKINVRLGQQSEVLEGDSLSTALYFSVKWLRQATQMPGQSSKSSEDHDIHE